MQESNTIYLSKDSHGEVMEFDNLTIVLPKKPRYKKDILYHDLPKAKQKWTRLQPPKALTREYASVILITGLLTERSLFFGKRVN